MVVEGQLEKSVGSAVLASCPGAAVSRRCAAPAEIQYLTHSGILGSPTGFFHLQMTFVFVECYPDMEENFFASLVSSVYS